MTRTIKQVPFSVQQAPKLTKVAAYARVSSGKDAMLHSLSAQVSYYNDLIQHHSGWVFCGVYADEALTGTKADRENFVRLIRDCKAGKVDILQNIAQLKALFEKQWEFIMGNCDEFLYLGGNEQGTHKYVSELLGKATIDTNTYGKSSGRSGNYSTNYQNAGRELMTPDEVRMLDNRYAILFVRGERPIIDEKLDIFKHPRVKLTTYGGAKPYEHGSTERAVATISLGSGTPTIRLESEDAGDANLELLSNEEIEALFHLN